MDWRRRMYPLEVYLGITSLVMGAWVALFATGAWPVYTYMQEVLPVGVWGWSLAAAGAVVIAAPGDRRLRVLLYSIHVFFWFSMFYFFYRVDVEAPIVPISLAETLGWAYVAAQFALGRRKVPTDQPQDKGQQNPYGVPE